jgi:hypothetical protein
VERPQIIVPHLVGVTSPKEIDHAIDDEHGRSPPLRWSNPFGLDTELLKGEGVDVEPPKVSRELSVTTSSAKEVRVVAHDKPCDAAQTQRAGQLDLWLPPLLVSSRLENPEVCEGNTAGSSQ